MNATLIRTKTGDSGTFGTLKLADGSSYVTGELPWRDNHPQTSCIPVGTYQCRMFDSPAHGPVYQVYGVPGRSLIEIHPANWFGDKSKGLKADMLGCIGIGYSIGRLDGQDAILSSKTAVLSFMGRMQAKPFDLTIVEHYPTTLRGATP